MATASHNHAMSISHDAQLPPSALTLSRLVLGHMAAGGSDDSEQHMPRGELAAMARLRERTGMEEPRANADAILRRLSPNTEALMGGG